MDNALVLYVVTALVHYTPYSPGRGGLNCNIYQLESDEGLTILRTKFRALCDADFLFFDHMTIDQHRKLLTEHKS